MWIELCPPERHVDSLTPLPVNGPLFGNEVLAAVSKLRRDPAGVGWALNAVAGVLMKIFGHRQGQRDKCHVPMKAEIGPMELPAQECQGFLATS